MTLLLDFLDFSSLDAFVATFLLVLAISGSVMDVEFVRWIEPYGEYEEWHDQREASIEPLQWWSVGVLVDENPVAITLATQVDLTTGSWMQLVTIPRKAIISRQRMSSGWTLSGGRASKSTKKA